MSKTLSIRLDNYIKNAADILFGRLGTNTAAAVKMFIYTAINNNKIPSQKEIRANSTENGNYTYMENEENVDDFLKRAMDNVQTYKGFWSFDADYDLRIIYSTGKTGTIIIHNLEDFGTHKELYGN